MKMFSAACLAVTTALTFAGSSMAQQPAGTAQVQAVTVSHSNCQHCQNGQQHSGQCNNPSCPLSRFQIYPDGGYNPPVNMPVNYNWAQYQQILPALWYGWRWLYGPVPQRGKSQRHGSVRLLPAQSSLLAAATWDDPTDAQPSFVPQSCVSGSRTARSDSSSHPATARCKLPNGQHGRGRTNSLSPAGHLRHTGCCTSTPSCRTTAACRHGTSASPFCRLRCHQTGRRKSRRGSAQTVHKGCQHSECTPHDGSAGCENHQPCQKAGLPTVLTVRLNSDRSSSASESSGRAHTVRAF